MRGACRRGALCGARQTFSTRKGAELATWFPVDRWATGMSLTCPNRTKWPYQVEILYNNWCRGLNFYLSVQSDIHVQVEACLPRRGCVLFPQRPQVKEERPHEDDNQWCYTVETKNSSPAPDKRTVSMNRTAEAAQSFSHDGARRRRGAP